MNGDLVTKFTLIAVQILRTACPTGTILSARLNLITGPRSRLCMERPLRSSVAPFSAEVLQICHRQHCPRLEWKVSRGGRGDEKANGDRVFCHFIDGRGVLRRRLAADGTAALSIGPSHGRRMDRHLFWSQCRLRLGTGLIKYRFWRWSDKYPFGERIGNSGRCDDATWPRRVGARWYGPVQLKQSARRHCWRSSRFQLASRNGRLRSRA